MAWQMTAKLPEIPAATLVVFRRGTVGGPPELLMVERSRALAFAGGMAVFPGGRVDQADRALAHTLGVADAEDAAHRIAAVRETIEETGLAPGLRQRISAEDAGRLRAALAETGDLAAALQTQGLSLALDALIPFARWCPRGVTSHRIFDTRFYLADLGTGAVDLAVDATENTRLFWTTAADALAAADRGDLSVIFPTRRNLERLALFASFTEARAQAEAIPMRLIVPRTETRDGRDMLIIPEDAGYPITAEPIADAMRR